MSRTRMTVVSTLTTSSTNITGFFISTRGSSLTTAAPIAGMTILASNSAETGCLRACEDSIDVTPRLVRREQSSGGHREMLDDRAERERGEERQSADDEDHADQQADEQ